MPCQRSSKLASASPSPGSASLPDPMPLLRNSLPPHCHAVLCRGIPSPTSAKAPPRHSSPLRSQTVLCRRCLLRFPSPALLNANLIFPLPARCPAFPVFSRPLLCTPVLCPRHATLCHAVAQQCHASASALRCDALPMHRKSIPRPSAALRCYASPLPGYALPCPRFANHYLRRAKQSRRHALRRIARAVLGHPLPSPCFSPLSRRCALPRKAIAERCPALPPLCLPPQCHRCPALRPAFALQCATMPLRFLATRALPTLSWSILRLTARRLAILRLGSALLRFACASLRRA